MLFFIRSWLVYTVEQHLGCSDAVKLILAIILLEAVLLCKQTCSPGPRRSQYLLQLLSISIVIKSESSYLLNDTFFFPRKLILLNVPQGIFMLRLNMLTGNDVQ